MKRLLPLLLLVACKPAVAPPADDLSPNSDPADPSAAPLDPPSTNALGAVNLRDELAIQAFSFPLPAGMEDPLVALRTAAAAAFPDYTVVAAVPEDPKPKTLVVKQVPAEPFESEFLQAFGRGLTPLDTSLARNPARHVFLLVLAPGDAAVPAQLTTLQLVHSFAAAQGALVFDESTRELFNPATFRDAREPALTNKPDNVNGLIAWHGYRSGELIRLVSLGMDKVALPDLVVPAFPSGEGSAVQLLASWVAAELHRNPQLGAGGTVVLDPAAIEQPWLREALGPEIARAQRATLRLEVAEHEDGDSPNRLLAIRYDAESTEGTEVERMAAIHDRLFGASAAPVIPPEDLQAALDAATMRAIQELSALKPAWSGRRPESETLLVKAPFNTAPGHTEFMWLEVMAWEDAVLRGLLQNTAHNGTAFRSGMEVTVAQSDVIDYDLTRADGTQQGSYTTAVLQVR